MIWSKLETRRALSAAAGIGLLLSLTTGCAGGSAGDPPEDMGSSQDMAQMTTPPTTDMGTPDPPDMSMPEDMAPVDMGPPMICTPNQKSCKDASTVTTCSADGLMLVDMTCGEGDECMDGACVMAPICNAGDTFCFDTSTLQICRDGGMAYRTMPCPDGTACVQGECLSGEVNGTLCSAADDCSGGKCHCGDMTDEQCADDFATPAYCTSECASDNDCGEDEWCFSADVALITATNGNYNHCVKRCQGTCAIDGLTCLQLPVLDEAGDIDWQDGCYFQGVKTLGEDCTSDVECASGFCLTDYYTKGFCSYQCEAGTCPDNAACVELKPGENWCTLLCGDGSVGGTEVCPKDMPDDRLDVTCSNKPVVGGGVKRVCTDT